MIKIPMASPDLTDAEIAAVTSVLRTGTLSLGPRIDEFEKRFAAYVGMPFAAGLSSGTAALHLAMIAAEVEEHDLVVTTPFSFVASANCVLYQRGIPVFVDVDARTGNIDPALVAEAVARPDRRPHPRTGAAAPSGAHAQRRAQSSAARARVWAAGRYGSAD